MFRRVGSAIEQSETDKKWNKKVLGIARMEDYDEEDFLDDNELELVSRVFGIYDKNYEAKFNSKIFTRN